MINATKETSTEANSYLCVCLIGTKFGKWYTWKTRNLCLIDSQIPKTAGLAGLLNLLLQKAQCLADLEEILDFICRTLKMKRLCSVAKGNQKLYSSLPSTRLVFVFFN